MNNAVIKNVNNGNVTKWIQQKGVTNNLEIQKFKSNVLAIASQYGLDQATSETIISSCYQSVLLNLPLEKNFGYCYVVPRWNGKTKVKEAQFQMGWKGYVQLALRSQQYKDINITDVREGEIKKFDRLKGIKFNWLEDSKRLQKEVIGYVASFKLKNGFYKELYWSKEQMESHFLKWSDTYKKNKKFELATFDDMALKTVLTQLLRKWGIMSVEMQQAYESDQAIIMDDEKIYIDNPNNNSIVSENSSTERKIDIEKTITPINNSFNFEEQQEIIDNLELD